MGHCLQINAWFLENRDPETGEYPDFPDDEDAGSKIILNPPPAPPPPAPATDGKKGAKKAPPKPKAKGKGKGKFVLHVNAYGTHLFTSNRSAYASSPLLADEVISSICTHVKSCILCTGTSA